MQELSSWDRHQELVLAELRRAHVERAGIVKEVTEVRIEVARLKAMASMWGALAGIVAGAVASLLTSLLSHS